MAQIYTRAGGEMLLNTTIAGNQRDSVLGALSDGGFVAAWTVFGFGEPLRGQRFDATGAKQGVDFSIAIPSGAIIDSASVVGLAGGGFVVAWGVFGDTTDPSQYNVKAQLFDPAGTKVGGELVLSLSSENGQMLPDLSPLPGGGFLATWMDYVGDNDRSCIKGQLFDAQGARVGAEFVVNTTTAGQQLSPSVAMLTDGFVVTWQDSIPDGTHNGVAIRAQRFSLDGTKVGAELLVSTPGGAQVEPEVAGLSGGGFVVVWEHRGTSTIQGQLYDSAGAPVGGQFQANTNILNEQSQPAVAALPDGGFVVSWTDFSMQAGDSSGAVRAQLFDSSGARSGTEFLVNLVTAGDQQEPDLTVLQSGDFVVSWTGRAAFGGSGDGSGDGIKAQIFTAGGPGLGTIDYSDDVGPVAVNLTANLFLFPAGHPYATRSLGPGEALDGSGSYEMVGGIQNFILTGGNDRLIGSDGANRIEAGAGNDNINGAGGNDLLLGDDGDDVLIGGDGDDSLYGGAGNDRLEVSGTGTDVAEGGSGTDTLVVAWGDAVTAITMSAPLSDAGGGYAGTIGDGGARSLTYSSIEIFNVATGTGADNIVTGDGNDEIRTGGGNDIANSGAGNDFIDGGSGDDSMTGGTGDDTYVVSSAGDVVTENVGEGTDEVRTALATYVLAANVENLSASSDSTHVFLGNSAHNVVTGGGGIDNIDGSGGNDLLLGNAGDDVLIGGSGNDSVYGGAGNDRLEVSGTGTEVAEGGLDTDTLVVAWGDAVTAITMSVPVSDPGGGFAGTMGDGGDRSLTYSSIEIFNVTTGSGNDVVCGGANFSAFLTNYYNLGGGNDLFYGLGGNDSVDAGDGVDGFSGTFGASGGAFFWSLEPTAIPGLQNTYRDFEYFLSLTTGSGQDNITTANLNLDDNITLGANGDSVILWNGHDTVNGGAAGAGGVDSGLDTLVLNYGAATGSVHLVGALASNAAGYSGQFTDDATRSATFEAIDRFLIATGSGADTIVTGNGNDQIRTGANNDVVESGGGNDFIDGGSGEDMMTGGTGNDVYVVSSVGDAVIENAGEGVDEVRTVLAAYVLAANVENLTATSDIAHDLRGNSGANVVTGGGGADLLRLYDGGDDTVLAGTGNDNIFFGAALTAADIINGGEGTDTLVLQGPYGSLTLTSNITQIENISLLGGGNTNFGDPGTNLYDYVLTTNDANFAAGVQARINGAALLVGEDFTFNGSAETDAKFVVYGGKGQDTLIGGFGADIFIFA
ncbi:MAG: hypothetical protein QOJ91_639, partial [Sphingomonadales bacterium]|nr:hypothetical protein [Sphingomonadales bacterium]